MMEGICGFFDGREVQDAKTTEGYEDLVEIRAELMQGVEGFGQETVVVTGDPFRMAERMDSVQGDNLYHVASNCGLVSCANYLNLCGIEATEDEIVNFALKNYLCSRHPFGSSQDWGGTTGTQMEAILESYGVESSIYDADERGGSLEGIANAVEEGHAVIMTVNAGYLWDSPDCVDNGRINHAVTVTGTIRGGDGELTALTICDSGRGLQSDSCRVVPVKAFQDSYVNAGGAQAIISDQAVR